MGETDLERNSTAVAAAGRLSCCASIAVLLMVGIAQAQECHAPAGRWVMDSQQSQLAAGLSFNPYYKVDAVALAFSGTAAGTLRETWRFDGPHVHETDAYGFRINGQRQGTHATSVLDTVPLAVTPAWQNCTLLITGYARLFGTEIATRNIYVWTDHGATLTILQNGSSAIGHTERALVFRRAVNEASQ